MNQKLTDGQKKAIRTAYSRDGLSMRDLAAIYRVSRMHIWRLVRGISPVNKTIRSFIA